ncbi:MAG: hypothetical protein HLUCCA08_08620 [Rhodobacteraceae bacterium HLUCCA08]|nr:MAG: hypothetical protein HLUCCA08_08620 [Rhodobacteraceae bacterium HLUCCA08]
MLRPKTIVFAVSAMILSACEVDVLDPAVQGPAQRAALAAAEGGVPGGQRVQEGTPIRVHLTDGGYVGSGDLRDMNNFRPISLFSCDGASCAQPAGTQFGVTDCQRAGDRTTCRERDPAGGPDLGRFAFYGDQRYSVENLRTGAFYSGVWYQNAAQKSRAERQYATMIDAFEGAFATAYERVSDERYAPIAALEAVGDAAIAANTPGAGAGTGGMAPDTGTEQLALDNRQVTVRDGYNIGNHPIEVQSRQVAEGYSCDSAQRIPEKSGGACSSFRALVIIEACTPQVVPPAAYNQDQPEFLRVAAAFANQGANLAQACF